MKSYEFLVKSTKQDIDFINKIIEGHEGIGVVRTIDPRNGIIKVITNDDFLDFTKEVLLDLKKLGVTIEIEEEGYWEGEL